MLTCLIGFAIFAPLGSGVKAAERIWNGGGETDYWNEALNWNGLELEADDILHFAGSTRLATSNNFTPETAFGGIVFDAEADAFTLSGNAIELKGAVINNSNSLQTINLQMNMGAAARTFDVATGSITVSQAISGTGGLIKNGSGVLTLSASNPFTGGITINSGTLRTTGNRVATSNSIAINGGTWDMAGGEAIASLSGTGGTITANGSSNVVLVLNNSTNDVFGGQFINGTRTISLTKSGTGTLTLTGANAWATTQNLTISGGRLILGHANVTTSNAGAIINSINNGLGFAAGITNFSLRTLTGTGSVTLEDEEGLAVNLTLTKDNMTFAGALNGKGTLIAHPSVGTMTLTGALNLTGGLTANWNTVKLQGNGTNYTGTTTLNGGTLSLEHANALGSSGEIFFNGGTLAFTMSNATDYADRLLTIATSKTANINVAADQTVIFASPLTGDGALTKTGTGTLVLTSSSSYERATTLNAGKLAVSVLKNGGEASSIGSSTTAAANLVINGSTLSYTGAGGADGTTNRLFTVGTGGATLEASGTGAVNFNGAGSIVLSGTNAARTLTLSGTNTDLNTLGLIIGNNGASGTTSLTKSGAGTWVVTAQNSYTGKTTVSNGRLIVDGSIAASSGVEVAAGAFLGGHGVLSRIGGAGTVTPGNSPGILTSESVDGSEGLNFEFEFTLKTMAPDFLNVSASGNDVLRLTGDIPFNLTSSPTTSFSLTSDNTITLDFSGVVGLKVEDVFLGGFYTDKGDFINSFSAATFHYVGLREGMWVNVTAIQQLADFGDGDVNGYITRFEIMTSAIPEPGTYLMLILGGAAMLVIRRRQRSF